MRMFMGLLFVIGSNWKLNNFTWMLEKLIITCNETLR